MEEPGYIEIYCRRAWRSVVRWARWRGKQSLYQHAYLIAGAVVLLVTTVFWAVLGARLQLHNADQLSDPYMFSNWQTFQGAIFPGAHTFLFKWPIFWLVGIFGVSSTSLLIATVLVTVVTVGALAWLLWRIDRRPLVLGTFYLALAFVLLLVPAQPYAGGVLPVNMAMLTTRNLEYVLYGVGLVLCLRAKRLRDWRAVASAAVLGVLIASDKLFLGFGVGGAALALVVYALCSNWSAVSFAVRWLAVTLAAGVGAVALIGLLGALRITNFTSGSGLSPYGVGGGAKDTLLGAWYAVGGFLTNLGANPVYDNRSVVTLPRELGRRLVTIEGVLHVLALVLLITALVFFAWRVVRPSFKQTPRTPMPIAIGLSLALLWSTVAAVVLFVGTHHYYVVDARYLTIGFFAVVITVAVGIRGRRAERPKYMLALGGMLLLATVAATTVAHSVYMRQNAAFDTLSARNAAIAQMLKHHPVHTLVADYWRALPIRHASGNTVHAMPLSGCTTPSALLTSSTWQTNVHTHSFAYLISFDGSLTNYPSCTLAQVTKAYGRPNSVQLIAGTLASPKEALLFYDQGSHPRTARAHTQPVLAPLVPVNTDKIINTACSHATIMNVVAHELLFMSPDLLHEVDGDNCVRTVYLTAGDAGHDKFYWLGRQLGMQAAYATMLDLPNEWDQQVVAVAPGQYVTIATLRASTRVSLVFMNLPDGNLHGEGFQDTGSESLAALHNGAISALHTVDGQSAYNYDQLVSALATFMNVYQPAEIHTQSAMPSSQYPDHSDHITAGMFATAAEEQYAQQHFGGVVSLPITRYIGYPIHSYDSNVSGEDLRRKQDAFFAYGRHDGGVCSSIAQCAKVPTYQAYLTRQYIDY
jgi:hypothetical protein